MECWVLVLAEHFDGKLKSITQQLLSKGRELADRLEGHLGVLLLGFETSCLTQELGDKGADKIFTVDHPELRYYNPEIYTEVIYQALNKINPQMILLGYNFFGMELGPAIAARTGLIFASNCTALEVSNNCLIITRPYYRGFFHVKMEFELGSRLIVSLQEGALSTQTLSPRTAVVYPVPVKIQGCRTKVVGFIRPKLGEVDITQAKVIVAVGRGIKDKTNIQLAKALAEALGGVIACSRPLTDLGWLPLEYQVGMSGKMVKPKVYIACGISGASHHLMGMKGSGVIIAINTDSNAPIFNVAHYGVVGDLFEILPALVDRAMLGDS
jgi:electron transfer flavoprotein alpha subunit